MSGIDIHPELIWTGSPIAQCLNVYSPETAAIVTASGEASVVKIKNSDIVKVNENVCVFEAPCKEYFSLSGGHYVWGYGLRDFQILNLDSGTQHTHVVSNSGNDMIYSTKVIDTNNLKIWIDITHHSWKKTDSNDYAIIYDVETSAVLDTIYGYTGVFFRFKNGNLLCEHWRYPKPTCWEISSNLMQDKSTNKLTEELSKSAVNVQPKAYSPETQFMIGEIEVNDVTKNVTIKWNENYEKVKIEPFTIQEENDINLWEEFEISPDGKWAKTVARKSSSGMQREDTVTFFSINDTFPQSLSLPVYGGQSSRNGGGCFLETVDWGTVYIDLSPDKPGFLVVYKMRDVMAKVVEKMSKLAK